MEKQKRWQFYLILSVIVLTLINILPTVFYYTKPLKEQITEEKAESIAKSIESRTNSLEEDSKAWLLSFSKNLGIQPVAIELKTDDLGLFEITFKNAQDANLFKRFLPNAGALIPFVPAQLSLHPNNEDNQKKVAVSRQINLHFDTQDTKNFFHYFPKMVNNELSNDFRESIYDRVSELALGFGGQSKMGLQIAAIVDNPSDARFNDLALALSKEIAEIHTTF